MLSTDPDSIVSGVATACSPDLLFDDLWEFLTKLREQVERLASSGLE